jgi:homopolymeric O-antigen transport system permease protein
MLRACLQHRALLRDLIIRDLASRYAGTALGLAWTLLQPLLLIGLFQVVFSRLMATRLGPQAGPSDYFAWLCSGILPWFAVQETAHRASSLFAESAGLVKRVAFPPALLVGRVVGAAMVGCAVSFVALLGVLAALGRPPGVEVLLAVPAFCFLALLVAGLGCGLSVLCVLVRDAGPLVPLATTAWFWLTPIVYLPEILPAAVRPLLRANPLAPILSLFRAAAGVGPAPGWPTIAAGAGASIAALAAGGWLFRRLAVDIPDHV